MIDYQLYANILAILFSIVLVVAVYSTARLVDISRKYNDARIARLDCVMKHVDYEDTEDSFLEGFRVGYETAELVNPKVSSTYCKRCATRFGPEK